MKSELRAIGGTTTTVVFMPGHAAAYPMSAIILNPSAGTVYLGGIDVTTTNGFPLETDQSIEVDIVAEVLYGVATVTSTVHILRRGD